MSWLYYVCALLILGWQGMGVESTEYVHEIYAKKDNTNRSVACGVCEARDGQLARRPQLDDWEIQFGNWSHLDSMDFWVDLVKTEAGEWVWGDGQLLDMNSVTSLPMTPAYNNSYTDWNCAVWNLVEPFYLPTQCSVSANILCQIPSRNPAVTECVNSDLNGKMITSSASPTSTTVADLEECKAQCLTSSSCWAGDWNGNTRICRLLNGASVSERPSLPALADDGNYITFGRTCVKYEEMSPEDSDFVCNCGAIEIPETEEAKEQFLEEHKEEVNKELIVPTETLSATIRKKESAPDERTSSTSIGYLGVTMMVVVFGGLVLMDITSLLAHVKMAASNVKTALINEEENATDA